MAVLVESREHRHTVTCGFCMAKLSYFLIDRNRHYGHVFFEAAYYYILCPDCFRRVKV